MQIYAAESGRLESYSFQEGDRFSQGQFLLRLNNGTLSSQLNEIDREIETCKKRIAEEKERLDQAMHRYIQAQYQPDVESILTEVQEAQQNGTELDQELGLLQNQRMGVLKKMENFSFPAPFEGMVLRCLKQPGELAHSGEPILLVCNAKERWIETEIPERLLSSVHPGAEALIEFPSFPGQKWNGAVSWVSPLVQDGKIRVKLTSPNLPLQPGLSAQASIKIH